MNRGEITVIPKYGWRLRFALFTSPLLAVLAVLAAVAGGHENPVLYLGWLFPIAIPFLWLRTYKRIRFGNSIVLERFVLPPRVIEYTSIRDVGVGLLKTTHGAVVVTLCENVEEFDKAVEETKRRGYWTEAPVQGKAIHQQLAAAKTALVALPLAIVGAFVAVLVRPFGLRIHWFLWFLGAYVVVSSVLYLYHRRKVVALDE